MERRVEEEGGRPIQEFAAILEPGVETVVMARLGQMKGDVLLPRRW